MNSFIIHFKPGFFIVWCINTILWLCWFKVGGLETLHSKFECHSTIIAFNLGRDATDLHHLQNHVLSFVVILVSFVVILSPLTDLYE